jgi:hypothetical protein
MIVLTALLALLTAIAVATLLGGVLGMFVTQRRGYASDVALGYTVIGMMLTGFWGGLLAVTL